MITGYNTDVRHSEVVFHVQTEDKGEANPFIESLVYVGGQVLAARRAGYAELLTAGQGEAAVLAMMERQHRTMIAAIRQGKLDGKLAALRSLARAAATGAAPAIAFPAAADPEATADETAPPQGAVPRTAVPQAAVPAAGNGNAPDGGNGVLAAAAAAERTDRTLDQVILDYLSAEAEQEQLVLSFSGETAFVVGRDTSLELRAASSRTGAPVADAEVTVRMISTVTEPQSLARGRTDDAGCLRLDFEIPVLGRGTAALIISADSALGPAELKQLL
jgi:hypothetical protein